jgi:heterodisulfide reductase subunit A
MARIGVFICHCGSNIADRVDVARVAEEIGRMPEVALAREYKFMCSSPGQQLVEDAIKEHGLNRIVIAACSPRMHTPTFQRTIHRAGLNPYLLAMANVREQCSWVTLDGVKATDKAIDLVRRQVKRVAHQDPLTDISVPLFRRAMVIGGGIAGIQAALDIADGGHEVILVEKSPSIGGKMAQLDETFPTLDCSQCILTPKMVEASQHPKITLLTCAEVEEVDGFIGNFAVTVKRRARYVDEKKCTACGDCTAVCPITVPSEFNEGLQERKAIYVPFPQAIPQKFAIDRVGVSPCTDACPAHIEVQGYVTLVREGKFAEALALIRERNPLPAVCGRVCPHPCEDACNRKDVDEPIAINAIKRFLTDWEMKQPQPAEPAPVPNADGAKVAIVGAGPGGLSAAWYLARVGYRPTIFEALPVTGGTLRTGIPAYRLPPAVLDHEVETIKRQGVEIRTSTPVGLKLTWPDLLKQGYKAAYISIGMYSGRKLDVPGEELPGVVQGIEFLWKAKRGEPVAVRDRRVVVVGGGSTAMDAARTALRLGARSVSVVYRRTRAEMPAFKDEIAAAEHEGVEFRFLATPVRFSGKGKVEQVECVRMELGEPDSSGRRRPVAVKGSEFAVDADLVVVAAGQSAALEPLRRAFGDELEFDGGAVGVDPLTRETSVPGVFAGGDCIGGTAIAIQAIADGREGFVSIDRYLRVADMREGRTPPERKRAPLPDRTYQKQARERMPELGAAQRTAGFDEVELGFTEEMARHEAGRCAECNICATCKQCEKACKAGAIDYAMVDRHETYEVGALVVATGYQEMDQAVYTEYGGGTLPDVITGLQFERLVSSTGPTGGKLVRPSDGREPKTVVFVQCVGSRDPSKGHEYCSGICCMYTAKHAMLFKHKVHGGEAYVCYIDIRSPGKDYEQFVRRAIEEDGVRYIRGRVGRIARQADGRYRVYTEDSLVGRPVAIDADLVVLASAVEPNADAPKLAQTLGIAYDADGFYTEAHPKLRPVETATAGVFLAGACQGPKDIPATVQQASAAAAKVLAMFAHESLTKSPQVAAVDQSACAGCFACAEVCPYAAIQEKQSGGRAVADVIAGKCQGCGACVATCRGKAITLYGFSDDEVFEEVLA